MLDHELRSGYLTRSWWCWWQQQRLWDVIVLGYWKSVCPTDLGNRNGTPGLHMLAKHSAEVTSPAPPGVFLNRSPLPHIKPYLR